MAFATRDTIKRRLGRQSANHFATVEVGRGDSKSGIIIHVDNMKSEKALKELLEAAYLIARSAPAHVQRPGDAGWWAGIVCTAALDLGYVGIVYRGGERSKNYAALVVEPAKMLDLHPQWPTVMLASRAKPLDMRGLASGVMTIDDKPSDADLLSYAILNSVDADERRLRDAFDNHVIGWSRDRGGDGRWLLSV